MVEETERVNRMAHVNFVDKFGDKCTLILAKDDTVFLAVGEDPDNREVSTLSLQAMREFISEVDKDG